MRCRVGLGCVGGKEAGRSVYWCEVLWQQILSYFLQILINFTILLCQMLHSLCCTVSFTNTHCALFPSFLHHLGQCYFLLFFLNRNF